MVFFKDCIYFQSYEDGKRRWNFDEGKLHQNIEIFRFVPEGI